MPGCLSQLAADPINNLPPEILSRILESFVREFREEHPEDLSWITVTHVCKHWYRVAKETPRMWAEIDFSNPIWAKEMLVRSKAAPLSLYYVHDQACEEMITQALIRLPRVERLVAYEVADDLGRFVDAMCDLPAPRLEHLQLMGEVNQIVDIGSRPTFLGGYAPRLESVKLLGCIVDPNTSLFRNVTHFCLATGFVETSIPDLLTLLSNLPFVEQLTLGVSLSPPTSTQLANLKSASSVKMEHLKHLTLVTCNFRAGFASPVEFLRWIKFSKVPQIAFCQQFFVNEGFDSTDAVLYSIQTLLRHYPVSTDGPFVHLDMMQFQPNGIDELLLTAQGRDGSPSCTVSLTFPDGNPPSPEQLQDISTQLATEFARRIPRKDLESMVLDGIFLDYHTLCNLFGGWERLESISTYMDKEFIDALVDTDANDRLVLPALKSLTFFDTQIGEDEDSYKEELDWWMVFSNIAKHRVRRGVGPTKVILSQGLYDSVVREKLQEHANVSVEVASIEDLASLED